MANPIAGLAPTSMLYHGAPPWSTSAGARRVFLAAQIGEARAMPTRRRRARTRADAPALAEPDPSSAPADADERGEVDGLKASDPGIRMLARAVAGRPSDTLLLVHCGDLPGLAPGATRLILDVRERTGSAHRCIADLAGIKAPAPDPAGRFAAALVWPRAHLGKDFSEHCLARAALAVREGGQVLLAVRKQKGGKSLGRTLRALLGDDAVEVRARERGYHLWVGERGPSFAAGRARELIERGHEIRDPALGELELLGAPGVFSRRQLDAGSRALLAVAAAVADQAKARGQPPPRRILDVGAGLGPLSLWAAARWPTAEVLAVESNLRAAALLRQNAARNGLAARVRLCEHDGLPTVEQALAADELAPFVAADLALVNPPTHADPATLRRLLDLRGWLAPTGQLLLVVNRPGRALEILDGLGAEIDGGERDGYFVLAARWPRAT